MNIGQWYSYTGTPSGSTSTQQAGLDVMVVSQNQINNTSLVRIRPWIKRTTTGTGAYNLSNKTMTIKANNVSRTTTIRYDLRDASNNTKVYLKSDFPFKLILIDIKKDVLIFNLVDLNENIISEVSLSKDFVIHNINSAEKIIRYRKKYDLFYSLLELSLDTLVENINYLLSDKNLSNKNLKELLDKKEAYIIYQRNVMKKAKYFYDNFLDFYIDENSII